MKGLEETNNFKRDTSSLSSILFELFTTEKKSFVNVILERFFPVSMTTHFSRFCNIFWNSSKRIEDRPLVSFLKLFVSSRHFIWAYLQASSVKLKNLHSGRARGPPPNLWGPGGEGYRHPIFKKFQIYTLHHKSQNISNAQSRTQKFC